MKTKRHGHTGWIDGKHWTSPTYNSWMSMKQRCKKTGAKQCKYWGNRGITVCERWLKFENFLEDMGVRPENTSIDRIDVNGNYEPNNCRWATSKEQNNNTRLSSREKIVCEKKIKKRCEDFKDNLFEDMSWYRDQGCTLQAIGDYFGYTRERIRQLLSNK